ncbi:MAG: LuxR family transcriptional regulator [Devosia sp.]
MRQDELDAAFDEQGEAAMFDQALEAAVSCSASQTRDAALAIIAEARGLNRAIKAVRTLYRAKHMTYVAARYGHEPQKDPFVKTTYPPLWLVRYLMRQYWRVDKIGMQGFLATAPFDWRDVPISSQEEVEFLRDARAHKVGKSGLIIPLTDRFGRRGILSITSDKSGEEWERFKAEHLADFLVIGNAFHTRGVRDVFGEAPPPPKLSPREKEVLSWVAEGKEVPDIAIIIGLSEHTVRTYIKSARLKLDCTTQAQAAVKADRLSLLGKSFPDKSA